MRKPLYNVSWVGIDAGREGLWQEPVWSRVIEIVEMHQGERVYDPTSPIYSVLVKEFPKEKWCSLTPEKNFRPLFRDYPNSWTRTGVISLKGQEFNLTALGKSFLNKSVTKSEIFISMFSKHVEENPSCFTSESPFSILASAFIEAPRPMTAKEIYWIVMKNYRPGLDNFKEVFSKESPHTPKSPEGTPFRRIRHMLQLMRASNGIESYKRSGATFWGLRDKRVLEKLIVGSLVTL